MSHGVSSFLGACYPGYKGTELEEVVQHGTQASGWGCCGFLSLGLFLTQRFD